MLRKGLGSQTYTVFTSTISPGDVLWVPANSLILESVMDRKDCFGLRWAMILKRDVEQYQTFADVANNKMTASSHISKRIVELVAAHSEAAPPAESPRSAASGA